VAANPDSHTGRYLAPVLLRQKGRKRRGSPTGAAA